MKPTDKARCARFAAHYFDTPFPLVAFDRNRATVYHHSRHEEGWSSICLTIEPNADGSLLVDVEEDGRDCDGRSGSSTMIEFREKAKARRFYMGASPRWKRHGEQSGRVYARRYGSRRISGSQYDETAEAAGY